MKIRKLNEAKRLVEGPGASYTIKGTLENVRITKVGEITTDGNSVFSVDVEGTADFVDVVCESYMYGGKIESTPVKLSSVSGYFEDDAGLENIKLDIKGELAYALTGAKVKTIYGGGYSHSTFDGDMDCKIEDSYFLSGVYFEFTNPYAIDFVDRAVQAPDLMYGVLTDDFVIEDAFDDEDEAIEYAKEYGYNEVVEVYQYSTFLYADNESEDTDEERGETIWTREDGEDLGEKYIRRGAKRGLKEAAPKEISKDELSRRIGGAVYDAYVREFKKATGIDVEDMVSDEDPLWNKLAKAVESLNKALYDFYYKSSKKNETFSKGRKLKEDTQETYRPDSSEEYKRLNKIANSLYRSGDDFDRFSDEELAILGSRCIMSEEHPFGRAYDDEVYDAISKRENSQEILNNASKIFRAELHPLVQDMTVESLNEERSPKVKTMSKEEGERVDISQYPNFSKTGSITGMRDKFYGKNAYLVRCGSYIYKVPEEVYNQAH